MSLTSTGLIEERQHMDGVQRLYKLPNGYGLSLVNATILHSYRFAWEAAVLTKTGNSLDYDTPLTNDVEVFMSDKEANDFIMKAIAWAQDYPDWPEGKPEKEEEEEEEEDEPVGELAVLIEEFIKPFAPAEGKPDHNKTVDLFSEDTGDIIATRTPANPVYVQKVLDAKAGDPDGRSDWMWFRLANGDLILGCYPSGDTYEETENDYGRP